MTRCIGFIGFIACAAAGTTSAMLAGQTRDSVQVVRTGTAAITGVVVADDATRAPVRRATVTVSRTDVTDSRTTTTDDNGRYVVDTLPAGSYTMSIAKAGYVKANYGAPKARMPGNPIPLKDGQRFAAEPVAIVRGGVITGRLLNPEGRPTLTTQVSAFEIEMVNGQRKTANGYGVAQTNAHGEFRIFGLPPGEYVVVASPTEEMFGQEVSAIMPEELQWAQRQLQANAAASAGSGPVAAPSARTRSSTYASVFYPGSPDLGGAAPIKVGPGEERTGIDLTVRVLPTSRVSGVVLTPDGRPVPGAPLARMPKAGAPLGMPVLPGQTRADADGRFSFANVTPGTWTLLSRVTSEANRDGSTGGIPLFSYTDIVVAGEDKGNVVVQLVPGIVVSGRFAFEGSETSTPPPDPMRVTPRLIPEPGGLSSFLGPPNVTVKPDGTFRFEGLPPGRYRLSVPAPTPPAPVLEWTATSAQLASTNVLDEYFEVRGGENLSDLVIRFSDRKTELSGMLVDGAGNPAPRFYVLVYPINRKDWVPNSRWIKFTRAGVDGTFAFNDLPPGEYYLCALTEIETSQQYEPAYLDQFVTASIRLTLGSGEKRRQNLRIGG